MINKTECIQNELEFQELGRRKVTGKYDGGTITSDAGGLLLREIEATNGYIQDFAGCFKDHTKEKKEIWKEIKAKALAGKSTINRIEYSATHLEEPTRYKKILYDEKMIDNYFIDKFIQIREDKSPEYLILDIDTTDDPLHGHQQGRFFHGYYDCYCYLPLYIFCGEELLSAKLRTANLDPGNEALPDIRRVVKRLKDKWPEVKNNNSW